MAGDRVTVTQPAPVRVSLKTGSSSGIDQIARDTANSAFKKANSVTQNAFTIISVTGQSQVIADSNNDTLTLIAGTGILVLTDAVNDAITIVATGGSAFDQFARDQANVAFDTANSAVRVGYTTITANGTSLSPTSNADVLTITGAQANGITILANSISGTIDIGLQPSGVVPGTYGGTSNNAVITVDAFGRVTGASNVAPTFPTPPIQSKALSYSSPLLNEVVTIFFTNTQITMTEVQSVISGITPNMTFQLVSTPDRSNTSGTLIVGNVICNNTTTGIATTSFSNPVVPANNFVLLQTMAIGGVIDELAATFFFSNP